MINLQHQTRFFFPFKTPRHDHFLKFPRLIDASKTKGRQHITGDTEKALSLLCDSVMYGICAHHSVRFLLYRFNPNYMHGTGTQLRETVFAQKSKKSKIAAQILTQLSLPSFINFSFFRFSFLE